MKRKEEITKKALELDTTNDIATFVVAAQWADKTMIDKACQWLFENVYDYLNPKDQERVESFRKYLED